jgi:hypothetical protein
MEAAGSPMTDILTKGQDEVPDDGGIEIDSDDEFRA